MATGLIRWGAALLGGMAFVFVRIYPFSGEPETVPDPTQALVDRFQELQEEVVVEREHLRRLVWLDSLAALLGSSGETHMVVIGTPAGVTETVAEAELAGESVAAPERRAGVGLFTVRLPEQRPPAELAWLLNHEELYVGEAGGRPYCMAIRISNDSRRFSPPADRPCLYVTRYGAPGPFVAEWLRGGSFSRGTMSVDQVYGTSLRRVVFRLRAGLLESSLTLAGKRCRRGDVETCAGVFLNPRLDPSLDPGSIGARLSERIPELWLVTRGGSIQDYHLGIIEAGLFAELEREFGRDRFERFWKSDQSVPAAFAEAFGTPHGEWLQGWASRYYVTERSLLQAGLHWSLTILALVAALLGLLHTAAKREVG